MSETAGETPLGRLVRAGGFGALARRLPRGPDPLVGYAVAVVTFELVVLQGLRFVQGYGFFFLESPLWLLRPVVLVGAAIATRRLHDRYDLALTEMALPRRAENPEQFERLVPSTLGWGLTIAGTGFTLANAIFIIGLPQLYRAGGIADIGQFLLVIPFGYVPVMAMFLATYVSIEVLVPRRVARSDVGLYYHDPENLGGMRPLGEVVKLAYYFLLVGLVAYAVALYGPYILGGIFEWSAQTPPGQVTNVLFTAVWGLSVGAMMYGLHTLHRFMRRQKREKLQELDSLAREHAEKPWTIEEFDVPEESRDRYDDVRARMELVSATREYPATFTMWAQFAVGVIVPKAVQFGLAAV
jgi:hypothetical protein